MTPGELALVDTDILLSATEPKRPNHEACKALFAIALEKGAHLAVCGQVLREYLVVATRPVAANGLGLKSGDALKNLVWFRKRTVYFDEPEAVHNTLAGLIASHGLGGKPIHDANIAALMLSSGIKTLITNNVRDFETFGLRVVTPEQW